MSKKTVSETTEITLKINTKILKMFQDQLDEMNENLDIDKHSFETWLEHEFNENGEVLLEMLLSDY